MIFVDKRESKPWTLTNAWAGVATTAITMKTGDYTNGIIIQERKSVADLIMCCGKAKRRFWAELDRGFDHLIIEGDMAAITTHLKARHSRMTPQYIKKCLDEITDRGIQVHLCKNREAAAALALEILTSTEVKV
jgi:L-lactate utilization protein LutB